MASHASLMLSLVIAYFLLLLGVAYISGRNSNNESFFIGNKNSNWLLVAFGMIGTSLSGVTFVSVPGTVASNHFQYIQVVIGYLIGYCIVAFVLLPLYYKLQVTSIYKYLDERFGNTAYKTGAFLFIVSRTIGATARLYLVIHVLQLFILNELKIDFIVTTIIILGMILMYTFKGGVKTIVITDTLQTLGMLIGLVACIIYLIPSFGNISSLYHQLSQKGYTQIFNTNPLEKAFFAKQILGGAFVTIAMTGLDQEMMQKNISVQTVKLSQKNMISFSVVMALVNILFLCLGGLLYLFAEQHQINVNADDVFPTIVLHHMPIWMGIIFTIGLISALFPSADGALTALTSSFCLDILGINRVSKSDKQKQDTRKWVHISFAGIFLLLVLFSKWLDNKSIIGLILDLAGYTYGPLLGLFSFGILTKRRLKSDVGTFVICLSSPIITYAITWYVNRYTLYKIGIELLILNGALTYLGLLVNSKKKTIYG